MALPTSPTAIDMAIAEFKIAIEAKTLRFELLFRDWPVYLAPRRHDPHTDDMRQMLDDCGIEPVLIDYLKRKEIRWPISRPKLQR